MIDLCSRNNNYHISRKFDCDIIMNRQESDILLTLRSEPFSGQRELAQKSGHSLGIVNKSLKSLTEQGHLDEHMQVTQKAKEVLKKHAPRNAIILAAGFGMRMVPINMETPKALLEVHGEVLIERLIRQLHDAGIKDITVVVGFMKEKFEYLIDDFHVNLLVNMDYTVKNNLHTLAVASAKIGNTYIVPCDIWCRYNPFCSQELYSWYMLSDAGDPESPVRAGRAMDLAAAKPHEGNEMVGIAYLTASQSGMLRDRLTAMDRMTEYDHAFWEEALLQEKGLNMQARMVSAADVAEINTYEQLREIDDESDHLKSRAIETIAKTLGFETNAITDIRTLKKGMTNRSFLFSCNGQHYIMRIPGEGTEQLINRQQEAAVYQAIRGKKISDEILFIDPATGYKITKYWENARVCDSENSSDLKACMKQLHRLHEMKIEVAHDFSIFDKINDYESLWQGQGSVYKDYEKVKEDVFSLIPFIEKNVQNRCLTHIDAVPDNFLILPDSEVRLIDWEYAGMQDPHVDIAMFCIYSFYEKDAVDRLIDLYFEGKCEKNIRLKIYCYIAACGLLWSNWCEYKRSLGVEFGEYSLRQYRYAKEYCELVKKEAGEMVVCTP